MTAVFCHNASDRSAETWQQQLVRFEYLDFAISDAAKGIESAIAQINRDRRERDPAAPRVVQGLDLFHTTQEAQRVLAQKWRRAESLWTKQYEQCKRAPVRRCLAPWRA